MSHAGLLIWRENMRSPAVFRDIAEPVFPPNRGILPVLQRPIIIAETVVARLAGAGISAGY
jgi:hypothetical protein